MADENEESEQDEAVTEAGSGKKKLIILIAVGVLVVLGSIGGTLFLLGVFDGDGSSDEASEESGEEVAAEPEIVKPASAMYFPIKPSIIVNFQTRGRQRMLQVDVTVLTREMAVFDGLQTHLPLIKNRLVLLYSGEVYEELQTDEGRELLRQKSLEAVQQIMEQEIGSTAVEQILFTNFVMQ